MGLSRSSRPSRALDWLPAALSVAMIVAESTATMSADNTSRWLYPLWARLFGPISTLHWAEVHHLIRKTGHFIGYGGVSVAFLYGWLRTLHRRSGKYRPIWLRAACRVGRAPQSTSASTSAGPLRRSFFFSRGRDVGADRTRHRIVSIQQRSDELCMNTEKRAPRH
jgi:hypothetical protein